MRDSEYIDLYTSILLAEQSLDSDELSELLLDNLELIKKALSDIGKIDQVVELSVVSDLLSSQLSSQDELESEMNRSLNEVIEETKKTDEPRNLDEVVKTNDSDKRSLDEEDKH